MQVTIHNQLYYLLALRGIDFIIKVSDLDIINFIVLNLISTDIQAAGQLGD